MDAAEVKLRTLQLPKNEKKFAKVIAAFVNKLLLVSFDEDFNEFEQSSRIVDPFLSGLLGDSDQGIYLRWTNGPTLEAKHLFNNM
ncbi:hypothetical protein BCV72DRAFT_318031 [Rhizopus microsporus var. microsporus]|uniref:Uncharacterized protein n=1 Tax=Rhizopus microsporus var. microsporus TaxID=86635 RepID=A0A1X0RIN9_RHIZD|nr:hypothetical protein BCV72DRAFT_318031 [Rhizopus microsporus var. microsporus]